MGVDDTSTSRLLLTPPPPPSPPQSGTTGESPTLLSDESLKLVSEAVRLTEGTDVSVIAGTGSNDTAATIAATRAAAAAGAHAALIVVPYYSRPTQAGLIAHFTAVAAQGGMGIIVYNIPGRSAVGLTGASMRILAQIQGIVAVKDATGGMDMASDLAISHPSFPVLSGDDSLTLPFMALGAVGVVSVVSNLFPAACVELVRAARAGDFKRARAVHEALHPFARAAFVESNPGPIKNALCAAGIIAHASMRLPLVTITTESEITLRAGVAATTKALRAIDL